MFFVNARALIERVTERGTELLVQTRCKPGEPERLELPGGRLEPYEPILEALRREVREETGLTLTFIEGEETLTDTRGMNPDFEVEAVRPFAVYQTVRGAFDSTGFYFRCRAEGVPLAAGDDAKQAQWLPLTELRRLMEEDPLRFTNVDRAGLLFYMKLAD